MRQNTGPADFPRQDDVTVSFNGPRPFAPAPAAPEGVTVCLPSAELAPAPAAAVTGLVAKIDESPVFVDDSGGRKRLLRIVGVLLGLLSISFIAVVGVALAVPTVANSVGLGDVVPFVVPGAAAKPPPPAPPAPPPFKPKKAPVVVKPAEARAQGRGTRADRRTDDRAPHAGPRHRGPGHRGARHRGSGHAGPRSRACPGPEPAPAPGPAPEPAPVPARLPAGRRPHRLRPARGRGEAPDRHPQPSGC